MDIRSGADPDTEIAQLRQQLQNLRQSVETMENLLERYVTAQQTQRRNEEQFGLLVSAVRDYAIFMLDTRGHIVSWNLGAQLIKGYSADEAIGQHFSIFYPSQDLAAGKPERALQTAAGEGVYQEEGWRVRKDGTYFWASVVITALRDQQGVLRGFGKVTRDLTERKRAEDAQRQLQEQEVRIAREQAARAQAEADLRMRDAFLNATAHELRTPVTSMFGYAELLQRRFDRGELTPERVQKPIHAISTQAQRLKRLTTMLLDLTQLEHRKAVLDARPIDLGRLIERVVQELQLLTEQHIIALDLPGAALVIEADELRLEQVLYNLIQNAVKYSPQGGTISVLARQEGQQALVTVIDEGVGIPAEDVPHVFERFYRATNISSAHLSGLGLGLHLVKEFVELHGGSVDVQSVLGQGSRFRVALPLRLL